MTYLEHIPKMGSSLLITHCGQREAGVNQKPPGQLGPHGEAKAGI